MSRLTAAAKLPQRSPMDPRPSASHAHNLLTSSPTMQSPSCTSAKSYCRDSGTTERLSERHSLDPPRQLHQSSRVRCMCSPVVDDTRHCAQPFRAMDGQFVADLGVSNARETNSQTPMPARNCPSGNSNECYARGDERTGVALVLGLSDGARMRCRLAPGVSAIAAFGRTRGDPECSTAVAAASSAVYAASSGGSISTRSSRARATTSWGMLGCRHLRMSDVLPLYLLHRGRAAWRFSVPCSTLV